MSIKSKGKKIAKKLLNKYFSYYSQPTVELSLQDENLIVKTTKRVMPNSFIEIKHRASGKRLLRKVKSSTAVFEISELVEMTQTGALDFYFKFKSNDLFYKKRVKFIPSNQFFKAISREKHLVLNSY